MNNGRLNELDALRGLAALAVVLYHYGTRYDQIYGHAEDYLISFKYGNLGVSLFFMISGFVIYLSLKKLPTLKEFIVKRVIRLFPAYIVGVILTYSVVSIFGLAGREVSITEALLNLTMLQGFMPAIENVDGVYWSLRVELTFYIIMAFLLMTKNLNKIDIFAIVWLSFSAIINIYNSYFSSYVSEIFITQYSHLFIAGIMFYYLREKKEMKKYHTIILLSLLYQFLVGDFESNVFVLFFFFIFYSLIYSKLSFLNVRVLKYLGTISYSLYLIHQNIGYIIIKKLESLGYTNEMYILIPVSVSILLASLITYFIEIPIQNCITTKYFKKKSKGELKEELKGSKKVISQLP